MLQPGAENILAKILCIYCLNKYGLMHHYFYHKSACKCTLIHIIPAHLWNTYRKYSTVISYLSPPRGKRLKLTMGIVDNVSKSKHCTPWSKTTA